MRFAILAILPLLAVGCAPEAPELAREPTQEPASVPMSDPESVPAPESASKSDLVRDQPSQKTNHESDVREIDRLTARVVEALRAKDVVALKSIGDDDFDAETDVRRWHNKLGEGLSKPINHDFIGKGVVALYYLLDSPHGLSVCYNHIDGEWKLRSVAVMGW